MKSLIFALSLLLGALAMPVASQNLEWYQTAEGFFANSTQVMPLAELINARGKQMMSSKSGPRMAGGGMEKAVIDPVAVLHTSGAFVNRGDEYVATLIMRKAVPECYIYYRIVYPDAYGKITENSRTEFLNPDTGGNGQGRFTNGLAADDVVTVYRSRVSNSVPGERLLDVAVTDNRGNLLQQVTTRYFVFAVTGQGLHYFRVRPGDANIVTVPNMPSLGVTVDVAITGMFPRGIPLLVMLGGPTTDRIFATAMSADGRNILLRVHSFATNREMDVTVYTDFFREAVTCRNCVLIGE